MGVRVSVGRVGSWLCMVVMRGLVVQVHCRRAAAHLAVPLAVPDASSGDHARSTGALATHGQCRQHPHTGEALPTQSGVFA